MASHIHLDLVGGIAGDMFIAALADARNDLVEGLLSNLDDLGAPPDVRFSLDSHNDGVLRGKRFRTNENFDKGSHTDFETIRDRIKNSKLRDNVSVCAVEIFTLLADAEANVHGVNRNEVNFHEVGAWDSVLDVVGAAYFIQAIKGTWSFGAVPTGGGEVATAHGKLPIPVPAVTTLLRGFSFYEDGLSGERVTPTGAAILKFLTGKASKNQNGERILLCSGVGFGSRRLVGKSNVLRALFYEHSESSKYTDQVGVVEFEIDDQTPEDLANAVDRLRNMPSVIDVAQWPSFGKKGRVGNHLQVLTHPLLVDEVSEACLTETATIGIRWRIESRRILDRKTVSVDSKTVINGPVRVKLVELPDGRQVAKADSDDLKDVPGGREGRRIIRGVVEEKARETKKTK